MELLQTFELDELKVETYYNGTDKLPNKVYLKNELILEDKTFRPSPLNNIDDDETMVSLLGFYTLRKEDVDEDYFKALNCPKLLEWAENDENVRMMLYDFENKDDDEYLKANEIDYDYCNRISNYITTV